LIDMGFDVKSVALPNQVTLQYAEQGDASGIPVLLLHGFAESWQSFELVLARLSPSIHTFALTQRGHGDASRPRPDTASMSLPTMSPRSWTHSI
jgi:non-heme chloroperoxidase